MLSVNCVISAILVEPTFSFDPYQKSGQGGQGQSSEKAALSWLRFQSGQRKKGLLLMCPSTVIFDVKHFSGKCYWSYWQDTNSCTWNNVNSRTAAKHDGPDNENETTFSKCWLAEVYWTDKKRKSCCREGKFRWLRSQDRKSFPAR